MRAPFSPSDPLPRLRLFLAVMRSRRGRAILIRTGIESFVAFAVCVLVGLLPPATRQSIYAIAFGLFVGSAVPVLSKRIWKPSR